MKVKVDNVDDGDDNDRDQTLKMIVVMVVVLMMMTTLTLIMMIVCKFFWGRPKKKIRRVCMEFSEYNWATISETICPQMLIFGK